VVEGSFQGEARAGGTPRTIGEDFRKEGDYESARWRNTTPKKLWFFKGDSHFCFSELIEGKGGWSSLARGTCRELKKSEHMSKLGTKNQLAKKVFQDHQERTRELPPEFHLKRGSLL